MDRIVINLAGLELPAATFELVDFEVVEVLVDFVVEDSLTVEEVPSASV